MKNEFQIPALISASLLFASTLYGDPQTIETTEAGKSAAPSARELKRDQFLMENALRRAKADLKTIQANPEKYPGRANVTLEELTASEFRFLKENNFTDGKILDEAREATEKFNSAMKTNDAHAFFQAVSDLSKVEPLHFDCLSAK
jgi:hypothetical protein